jgi:hypothetical protein
MKLTLSLVQVATYDNDEGMLETIHFQAHDLSKVLLCGLQLGIL